MSRRRQESTVTKNVSVVVDHSAKVDVDIDVEGADEDALELAQLLEEAVVDTCKDYCDGPPQLRFYR